MRREAWLVSQQADRQCLENDETEPNTPAPVCHHLRPPSAIRTADSTWFFARPSLVARRLITFAAGGDSRKSLLASKTMRRFILLFQIAVERFPSPAALLRLRFPSDQEWNRDLCSLQTELLSMPQVSETMSEFWRMCSEYLRFYQEGAFGFWRSLRPASYTVVLAAVWLIGFLLLKSGARR